jgi:hypothetical protein
MLSAQPLVTQTDAQRLPAIVLAGEILPADRCGDAAERVLVRAGEFQHLCGLGCGDI